MAAHRALQARTGSPDSGHHNYDLCPEPSLWHPELHRAEHAGTQPARLHPGASVDPGPSHRRTAAHAARLTFPSITLLQRPEPPSVVRGPHLPPPDKQQ